MKINRIIDHTNLNAFATQEDIKKLCDEASTYNFKSVCVNPCNIELAKKLLLGTDVLVCTVIGFPLGANTLEVKAVETMDAIKRGADEIDMVINIGKAKDHEYDYIEKEIKTMVAASSGHTLKVIIETCYLTEDEKEEVCRRAMSAGATFVKTSTGFGTAGAKVEDIELMKRVVGDSMEIKAAGGIHTLAETNDLIEAGATRIGASKGVQIMKELKELN